MWGTLLTRNGVADSFVRGLPRATDHDRVAGRRRPSSPGSRYADVEPGHREARCAVGGRTGPVSRRDRPPHYIGRGRWRRQVAALADLAAGLSDPVVVTGDLNATIDDDEVAPLTVALSDAFAAAGVESGDPRRCSSGAVAIDHVLVHGVEVLGCRVATEAGDLSDHWPVVANLRLPAGSEAR
jgi:hypothetical protein